MRASSCERKLPSAARDVKIGNGRDIHVTECASAHVHVCQCRGNELLAYLTAMASVLILHMEVDVDEERQGNCRHVRILCRDVKSCSENQAPPFPI